MRCAVADKPTDYPEEWPELLGQLLKFITDGADTQTNGALHVLNG